MSEFNTKVHHYDPNTLKLVRENHYTRYVRSGQVFYEQPLKSGKFYNEDGTEATHEALMMAGLKKEAPKAAAPEQVAAVAQAVAEAQESEAEQVPHKAQVRGRKPA